MEDTLGGKRGQKEFLWKGKQTWIMKMFQWLPNTSLQPSLITVKGVLMCQITASKSLIPSTAQRHESQACGSHTTSHITQKSSQRKSVTIMVLSRNPKESLIANMDNLVIGMLRNTTDCLPRILPFLCLMIVV